MKLEKLSRLRTDEVIMSEPRFLMPRAIKNKETFSTPLDEIMIFFIGLLLIKVKEESSHQA